MKCEIERMEINYTFYFFAFFEKVIKKLLTFCYWRNNNMGLIEMILDDKNLNEAVKRVKRNKGVAGVDKMIVYEIDTYFQNSKERIKKEILEKKYRP